MEGKAAQTQKLSATSPGQELLWASVPVKAWAEGWASLGPPLPALPLLTRPDSKELLAVKVKLSGG